ncbi:hypothetical protein [Flavihumibacter petaseus]|nr:hypothetical protein [Flavihumibacter petaseus]
MKLEIPYPELELLIRELSKKPISLRYEGNHKLEVNFMANVSLSVNKVYPHGVLLNYHTSGIVSMMISGMRGAIKKELEKVPPVSWLEDQRQLEVDLRKVPQLTNMLQHLQVTRCSFEENGLILELSGT